MYTNRYVDEKSTDEKPIRRLIELQRRLLQSKSPFARRIGTLLAAGALNNHLAELDDHQIGQLLLDEVGSDLGILQPEATICHQATQRLFRSENGSLEEDESPKPEPLSCPNCGNEMLFHYGIDEPDFYQCATLIVATSSLSRYRRESLIELAHIRKSLFVGAKSVKEHIG